MMVVMEYSVKKCAVIVKQVDMEAVKDCLVVVIKRVVVMMTYPEECKLKLMMAE